MSNGLELRSLENLVTPVNEKVTIRKDPSKPYVGLEHIPSRGTHLLGWSPATASVSTNSVFNAGDVLYGKLRPNLRKCVVAPFDGYCSTDILVLRTNDGVDSGFAGKILGTEIVGIAAEKTSVGTKMPRTSWKNLGKLEVFCPEVAEQALISKVLDTLDTAIHETEALIAKLKAVKQGLLHDLLTRGIDANGELRPPQAEAPQLYKESALGWIPKEWEAPLLVEVATRITDGTHQAVVTVTSGGDRVPFLFVSCVRDGKIAWNKSASITDSDYRRISKGREPVKGMTLYTVVGSYGHSAVFDETFDFAFQRHIACIYPDKARVIPEFIPTMLNWEKMRSYADRVALGNAQKTVTLGELSRYPFPLPTKFEQNEIILRLCAVQKTISGELSALKKLQLQKSGLMDDLLTGRVRVTPLLEGHAA
jgi:type I restriction enzyme S subunit